MNEAEAALDRVLALHRRAERAWPDESSPNCTQCGGDDWPCPTVQAITGNEYKQREDTTSCYVVDRYDRIWTLVVDGGMAMRVAEDEVSGFVTIGIRNLETKCGPLHPLDPRRDRITNDFPAANEQRRWIDWLAATDYGITWWNPEGVHPPIRAGHYAQEYFDRHPDASDSGHVIDVVTQLARNSGWADA